MHNRLYRTAAACGAAALPFHLDLILLREAEPETRRAGSLSSMGQAPWPGRSRRGPCTGRSTPQGRSQGGPTPGCSCRPRRRCRSGAAGPAHQARGSGKLHGYCPVQREDPAFALHADLRDGAWPGVRLDRAVTGARQSRLGWQLVAGGQQQPGLTLRPQWDRMMEGLSSAGTQQEPSSWDTSHRWSLPPVRFQWG